MQKLISKEDRSINWVLPIDDKQAFECRYVRRSPHYFIAYLSVQSGCNHGCKMCHLTAKGLTVVRDATADEIFEQAKMVFEGYDDTNDPARVVHFNFMARGEPLNSSTIMLANTNLFQRLNDLAASRGLFAKFLISTIMPKSIGGHEIIDIFRTIQPDIYYSLYSTNEEMRKDWLPAAMPVEDALGRLKRWQNITNKIPKIHYPFIKGMNDGDNDVREVCNAIEHAELRINFNIVRYNPYDLVQSVEPSESVIYRHKAYIVDRFPEAKVKVVGRVGYDVSASCGMFVGGKDGD